jgi:hypothetical protein
MLNAQLETISCALVFCGSMYTKFANKFVVQLTSKGKCAQIIMHMGKKNSSIDSTWVLLFVIMHTKNVLATTFKEVALKPI